mmetsp:Transcript_55438/g.166218  ORF Transcript_55438/g.166218 Transcript_55438/m.166218 type:complete len:351 (+) Transcript_55438:46-1098(+)
MHTRSDYLLSSHSRHTLRNAFQSQVELIVRRGREDAPEESGQLVPHAQPRSEQQSAFVQQIQVQRPLPLLHGFPALDSIVRYRRRGILDGGEKLPQIHPYEQSRIGGEVRPPGVGQASLEPIAPVPNPPPILGQEFVRRPRRTQHPFREDLGLGGDLTQIVELLHGEAYRRIFRVGYPDPQAREGEILGEGVHEVDVGSQSESRRAGRRFFVSRREGQSAHEGLLPLWRRIFMDRSRVNLVRHDVDLPLPSPFDAFPHDRGGVAYAQGIVGVTQQEYPGVTSIPHRLVVRRVQRRPRRKVRLDGNRLSRRASGIPIHIRPRMLHRLHRDNLQRRPRDQIEFERGVVRRGQ